MLEETLKWRSSFKPEEIRWADGWIVKISLLSKCDNRSKSASKTDRKIRTSDFGSSRIAKKSKRSKDSILHIISDGENEQKHTSAGLHSQIKSDADEATSKTPMSVDKVKLGMKVSAKVHQIRARGLVLDLGSRIRGMHRFEPGARKDFEVGDELPAKCSSFSIKGIPVLSLVNEE